MNYILKTPAGETLEFYILECAKVYQLIFGGTISDITSTQNSNTIINEKLNSDQA